MYLFTFLLYVVFFILVYTLLSQKTFLSDLSELYFDRQKNTKSQIIGYKTVNCEISAKSVFLISLKIFDHFKSNKGIL